MAEAGDHGSSQELILTALRRLSDEARESSFRMRAGSADKERRYLIAGRDGKQKVSSEEDESRHRRTNTE